MGEREMLWEHEPTGESTGVFKKQLDYELEISIA